MTRTALVLRADAAVATGTGHVMRCLALAQGWQDGGGRAIAVTAVSMPPLLRRLSAEGVDVRPADARPGSVEDAEATAAVAHAAGAEWVVVDGYHFGDTFVAGLKGRGLRVLVIDDLGSPSVCGADLVLNQNLHASVALYRDELPGKQLMLGPRYALLRREFRVGGFPMRTTPAVARRLLVTFGGSDPANVTARVSNAVHHLERDVEVRVVVGGSNPHCVDIERLGRHGRPHADVLVDTNGMRESLAWADAAVCAAGSTAWELAAMAVPAIVIAVAENQEPVAESLDKAGLAWNLGPVASCSDAEIARAIERLIRDHDARAAMAARGPTVVDGKGAARVAGRLGRQPIDLRPATARDARRLFEWANDGDTRAASFSQAPIGWNEHVRWLTARLQSGTCTLFIAADAEDRPVGSVRADVDGDRAVLSLSVAPECRGQGYGTSMIRLAAAGVLGRSGVQTVDAYVKPGNERSRRAFRAAGFVSRGPTVVDGHEAEQFTLSKVMA